MQDPEAIRDVACCYASDGNTHPKDLKKSKFQLFWQQAGKLGHTESYYNIGCLYSRDGNGVVSKDQKKANHYFELAAIGGHEIARYNLGVSEMQAGKMSASPAVNLKRAMEHFTIGWAWPRYLFTDDQRLPLGGFNIKR